MSVRTDILTAICTLVASVSALSATGRVQRGIPDMTALGGGPRAFVAIPVVTGRDDDQLGSFRRSAQIRIVVATPAAAGVAARDAAIDALMDSIVDAVEADRTVGGRCVSMVFESLDIAAGDEISESLSSQALGFLALRVEYITTSGTGF